MRSSHVRGRTTAGGLIALGVGIAVAPAAGADPILPAPPEPAPVSDGAAAATACSKFAQGLDLAAVTYEDFADNTSGDKWAYTDPIVQDANVNGRTGLRVAAGNALEASATPGLGPDISTPMQKWSLQASKLLILMGVHAPDSSINGAANDLNNAPFDVQMGCSQAGTQA